MSVVAAGLSGAAYGQAVSGPVAEPAEAEARDVVTVTATRTEQSVDMVAATVTVIDDRRIENELVTDIKDLVRFEPGVSVRNSPARFGAALPETRSIDKSSTPTISPAMLPLAKEALLN